VAQARLLVETVADPGSTYRIHWLTPYSLAYAPLVLFWQVASPIVAGKLTLLVLTLAVVAALHLIAARRDRAPEAAALASLLVFSRPLYWGFLSFLAAMTVLLGWLALCGRRPRPAAREAALFFAYGWLLYFAHGLALLAAAGWLVLRTVVLARDGLRAAALRVAALVPALALAATRAGQFTDGAFDAAAHWIEGPVARLAGTADAAFGGLRGPVEPGVLAVLGIWIVAGLARADRRVDRELLLAGAALFIAYLALPDKVLNTISFAHRWAPLAVMLLVLAAPRPRAGRGLKALVAGATAAASAAE
jgi:hypothetical protein